MMINNRKIFFIVFDGTFDVIRHSSAFCQANHTFLTSNTDFLILKQQEKVLLLLVFFS
jgi:hypothetical protein